MADEKTAPAQVGMHRHCSFIENRWVQTNREVDVVDPATSLPFAKVSEIDASNVKVALEAAQAAFANWRESTAIERGAVLHRVADELARRRTDVARTITLENGKPLARSEGEVSIAVDHLRWFAEGARRVYGRNIPNQIRGKRHLIVKTPIGVVGAIAPWNFPLVLSVRKVAPAIAAGCPVILKPSRQTPLSAVHLTECIEAAGVSAGIMREETFAPIAPISSFETEAEAINRSNDTIYGLSAYAMTRALNRIFRLSEAMEVGTLGINDGAPSVNTAPFGAVKQSGWGRELGTEGLEAFLETKHVSIGNVA